jgi:hypothetical protein
VIEALLEPNSTDLIWRASGPGRGTEMRRSFSGLFGRFFARAYLQLNHGYTWFNPIDGDPYLLSPAWRVKRKRGHNNYMPDWICAGRGKVAIGEAKGSNIGGISPPKGRPGPIRKAVEQITGVQVEKRLAPGPPPRWRPRTIKGWAVMSRWGTANPARAPYLYALDPNTDGDPLTDQEQRDLEERIARRHVGLIAKGLGIIDAADADAEEPIPSRQRLIASSADLPGSYIGAIFSPLGVMDMSVEQARALGASLPDRRMLHFVGLDQKVVDAFFAETELMPQEAMRRRENIIVLPDGLIVAPITELQDSDLLK